MSSSTIYNNCLLLCDMTKILSHSAPTWILFFRSISTFKQVNVFKWKNFTFPTNQKQKQKIVEGSIKNVVIEKLVGDPMSLNIIFKAIKNKNKSKRWALYLKNWASYVDFWKSTRAKSQFLKNFKFQTLAQCLRFGPEFFHAISIFI